MRSAALLTLLFTLQSCFIIRVYPPAEINATVTTASPSSQTLLASGKSAVIHGKQHDIFFHEEAVAPEGDFIFVADSIPAKKGKVVIRMDGRSTVAGQSAKWVSKEPLIVVDGVVQEGQQALTVIDPDQIATVNVLKDAAALKKYGEKGRNGVVEITTKQ